MKRLSYISSSLAKNFFLYSTSTLILTLFFSAQSCKSPTAPGSNRLSLTIADVSCTEVWLNLSVNNIPLPTNIVIKKNGSPFLSFNLTNKDTTLYQSSLLPDQTYTYQAEYGKGFATERSESVTAKTMDTTSNNFTWQTFTFGVGGDNGFNDVAILSPTSIWEVGKFSIQDSGTYNAAHWDGKKWNYYRFYAYNQQGVFEFIAPLTGVKAFSDSNIWFADGNAYHWSGVGTTLNAYWISGYAGNPTPLLGPNQGINKLWGTSSSNLYGCGINGGIAHYDGQNWQQIQSGTTLNIQDIWGVTDQTTGENQILCVASNKYQIVDKKVIQIFNNNATEISNLGLPWSISSIWLSNLSSTYIVGDGIFKTDLNNTTPMWNNIIKGITVYYSNMIRGNANNDIVICGAGGDIAHFNGISWKDYLGNGLQNFYGNLYGLAIKNNTVCAVGEIGSGATVQAVIILGKRN